MQTFYSPPYLDDAYISDCSERGDPDAAWDRAKYADDKPADMRLQRMYAERSAAITCRTCAAPGGSKCVREDGTVKSMFHMARYREGSMECAA